MQRDINLKDEEKEKVEKERFVEESMDVTQGKLVIGLDINSNIEDISYIPMIFCFVMFLANDLYGFFNWKRMLLKQSA